MAVYKVPQDVEADDKLIGPFSFRQFIYLIIVALAIAGAWGLSRLFIPLLIIPLPVIVFFGALALPLRKDQPMEIYLAAMVSFFFKPHRRLWDPDGIESLIEITVPRTLEVQRVKDITRSEAEQRFGYLAELVDSKGWAVRGVGVQAPNSALTSDAYFAAQDTEDILDSTASTAQSIDYKLEQNDLKRRQETVDRMYKQAAAPTLAPVPVMTIEPAVLPQPPPPPIDMSFFTTPVVAPTPVSTPLDTSTFTAPSSPTQSPVYNPYPDIQQTVLQPLGAVADHTVATPPVITSEKPLSPDIINLATNTDLSIETIAHEANRIHKKEDLSEEVIISLR